MNESLRDRVIVSFGLTTDQKDAAKERNRDVVVTAGAGSGKTRTLVARYVSLLADGYSPREIVAVTFTEKAAREMRSRVRIALGRLLDQAESETERERWTELTTEMDSARIGTIHSLCSEILRAHPAEAVIDPKFEIIDEGLASALKVEIVEDTLANLVGSAEYGPLFRILEINQLRELFAYLLDHRLEAQEVLERDINSEKVILEVIKGALSDPSISGNIQVLKGMSHPDLLRDAGETLAIQVEGLLQKWGEAVSKLEAEDLFPTIELLFSARRDNMGGRAGSKGSLAKESVASLKSGYDLLIDPLIGGKNSKDILPICELEKQFTETCILVRQAFKQLLDAYKNALLQRHSLDFDDLEDGAAKLLQLPQIRIKWQAEIISLLVDEFQDTNDRQRKIVEALAGSPGRLFVVGDSRQSIYRFRRADVTVFRSIQERVTNQGGLVIDLDLTFRTHEPLLQGTGDILSEAMGIEEDISRPFFVPFSPLSAFRKTVPEYISCPHIELVMGGGEDAESARPEAARALAIRLLELKDQGQIRSWEDVAVLFRASTRVAVYENAFEEAGIPFVTVAGSGFYERPEIRDVINILRALADPNDDLVLAGLLRSPAFGLTDTALYQLRWQKEKTLPYLQALQGDLTFLEPLDQSNADRALQIINHLHPLVDTIPVFDLLKELIDITDYRAILAIGEEGGTSGRLWRNLDKLLSDAQSSGQINVRDFLDYLNILKDAGARESEAPAEAQGSVRLMTIHKSKGLEFPIVVLADASREDRSRTSPTYILPNIGLAFKMDPPPLLYRLAKWQDQLQDDAEMKRLLYVAMTRSMDKLIINGHVTQSKNGEWKANGWMNIIAGAAEVDIDALLSHPGTEMQTQTQSGQTIRAWAISPEKEKITLNEPVQSTIVEENELIPLFLPITEQPITMQEETLPNTNYWRVTNSDENIPPRVIGKMVHKAIELWLFPGNPQFENLLETEALNVGLTQEGLRINAIRKVRIIMSRLHNHRIREEIESAQNKFHELPYSKINNINSETGYIDLMYSTKNGWQVIDFKTDSIRYEAELVELINRYSRQLSKYSAAVKELTGCNVTTSICFLDNKGSIELVNV